MIAENNCRQVALPRGALDLPKHINVNTIRNWIDFGLWGLVFYDDQSPWFALVECLHILHGRVPRKPLFEPPSVDPSGRMWHEKIEYEVPLNFHLRHFLFRDRGTSSMASQQLRNDSNRDFQWKALIDRTRENWKDSNSTHELDVAYLRDRFEDVRSLQQTLEVLRSAEVDAHTAKRWTSRHLLPLGPNMLFCDVREGTYKGDRRFMRRTGEMLYLMLGRSKPRLVDQLTELIDSRLVAADSPWNGLAGLFRPSKPATEKFKTGYLPFARMEVYDRLAEDWIAILSLERRDVADSLDALMRVSALHQVIYILQRAHQTRGQDGNSFPPFVIDLAASARKNPVQRVAAGQYDSHTKLPRYAIEAYIDAFADSPCWQELKLDKGDGSLNDGANKILANMWLWPSGNKKPSSKEGRPTARLDEFRTDSISRTGHSIWSVIASHTRGAGMVEARRGVGTWYAPNDAMLEALVLANVRQPLEFGDFIRTLYRRYRIVVGQEQAQQAFPGGAMSLERFKDNEHRLEERLRVLRFIDRKSDACAFVVNPFYGQASVAKRGS